MAHTRQSFSGPWSIAHISRVIVLSTIFLWNFCCRSCSCCVCGGGLFGLVGQIVFIFCRINLKAVVVEGTAMFFFWIWGQPRVNRIVLLALWNMRTTAAATSKATWLLHPSIVFCRGLSTFSLTAASALYGVYRTIPCYGRQYGLYTNYADVYIKWKQ